MVPADNLYTQWCLLAISTLDRIVGCLYAGHLMVSAGTTPCSNRADERQQGYRATAVSKAILHKHARTGQRRGNKESWVAAVDAVQRKKLRGQFVSGRARAGQRWCQVVSRLLRQLSCYCALQILDGSKMGDKAAS